MMTTTVLIAARDEQPLMVGSSCSSSVAAVTEDFTDPPYHVRTESGRTEPSSSSGKSALVTEESSNSNTTSKSDDSLIDHTVSFYERWHHEIFVLRAAIDEKIGLLAEQSQREMEKIAAQMTSGFSSPRAARHKSPPVSKYTISNLGPKVPVHQRETDRSRRTTSVHSQEQDPRAAPYSESAPVLESVLSQSSSSQAMMILASPSGRSHATATSDKTVPQSNLSKNKKKPYPNHSIRQVMSIPEESSLPNESDGGEDHQNHRPPNEYEHRPPEVMSTTSSSEEEEEVEMEECEPNNEDFMPQPLSHLSKGDQTIVDDHFVASSLERRRQGLSIITSHSDIVGGDDETRPIMTSIPSLPLSSTSFPSYVSQSPTMARSPSPAKSPPKPFYRFFDTIRELRSSREHRPWYQKSRDAPTMEVPRPDASPQALLRTVEIPESPGVASTTSMAAKQLDAVIANPADTEPARTPVSHSSALSAVSPITIQTPAASDGLARESLLDAELPIVATLPEASVKNAAARRKPLPEIFQKRTLFNVRRCSPKSPALEISSSEVIEPPAAGELEDPKEMEMPALESIPPQVVEDGEPITAPCLDIVVYNQERSILPHHDSSDASILQMEYVTDRVIQDPYNDEGAYTGILIRGKPDSYGSMVYNDGRTYSGAWKRGRWDGHGKTTFVNGDSYTGDYVQDQRHGVGRYEWADGRVYDGRFVKDQREGQGTYSWSNGSVYCGEFHAGLRHGYGTYTYEDGSVYNGQWQNGKQHGNGECVWADGRCFRGIWENGHAHLGIEVRADGTIRHNGEWSKDRPVRKSKITEQKETQKIESKY